MLRMTKRIWMTKGGACNQNYTVILRLAEESALTLVKARLVQAYQRSIRYAQDDKKNLDDERSAYNQNYTVILRLAEESLNESIKFILKQGTMVYFHARKAQ